MHLHHAHLLAVLVQIVHGLLHGTRRGAHHDHHTIRVGSAHVVEQMVLATRNAGHLVHRGLHVLRDLGEQRAIGQSVLHPSIAALHDTHALGMRGVQSALLELQSLVERVDLLHLVRSYHLDRGHFVGGTETIEEVKQRVAALQTRS